MKLNNCETGKLHSEVMQAKKYCTTSSIRGARWWLWYVFKVELELNLSQRSSLKLRRIEPHCR